MVVKTIGPLTDVDVIKLRACEKKQVPSAVELTSE